MPATYPPAPEPTRFGRRTAGYRRLVRIVITGASGNVGTALLRRLGASREHELVGGSRRRPPAAPPYDAAEWVPADLAGAGVGTALERTFAGADAVVHLAWAIQPQRRPDVLHRVNQ